jgi:hypothetical protein
MKFDKMSKLSEYCWTLKFFHDRSFWTFRRKCMIWVFHGGDYKECRPLGYKIPVHTSQEKNYVSVTNSSRLMLCKIWSFNGGDYEDAVFWVETTQSGSCRSRLFGGTYCLNHQNEKHRQAKNNVSSNYQLKCVAKEYWLYEKCMRNETTWKNK